MKLKLKDVWSVLKNTFTIFSNVNGLKFSASLSYYTMFSLGPMLLLIISLAAVFLSKAAVEGEVFNYLYELVGPTAAAQIQDTIKNLSINNNNAFSMTVSIITLLVGATTVFGDMQNSINKIWEIKPKPQKGWLKMLKDRLLSSSIILSLGFLLIVSFMVNTVLDIFYNQFETIFSSYTVYLSIIISNCINFLVITLLFGIIFKFLPDVNIKWRDVRAGALFTAGLFMVGKFLISLYISKMGPQSTYGAAGSVIVILLWVYYAAAILYLGASFTKAYAEHRGVKIIPAEFAVLVEEKEIIITPEEKLQKVQNSLHS